MKVTTMKLFGKDMYRALAIGFLVGCAGMALNANSMVGHAQAATGPAAVHNPAVGP